MALNNPQVQLVRLETPGLTDRYFMYITTHMDASNYEADGCDSISGPTSGKLSLVLKVKTQGLALRLNKPIVHQVELTDINVAEIEETEVEIYLSTTKIGSAIVSHDESETVVKPIGEEGY